MYTKKWGDDVVYTVLSDVRWRGGWKRKQVGLFECDGVASSMTFWVSRFGSDDDLARLGHA